VLLQQILRELALSDGIVQAAVVDGAGFIIESAGVSSVQLGPMATTMMATTKVLSDIVHRPAAQDIILEFDGGPVLIYPITQEEMLIVVATSRVQVGKLRYDVKALMPSFYEALGDTLILL